MTDIKQLIESCDPFIEQILDSVGVEFIHDNGWICCKCIFHNGNKYNLKYKNKSFYCFSECRESYNIVDIVSKQLNYDYSDSISWLQSFIGLDDCKVSQERITANKEINKLRRLNKRKRRNKVIEPVDQIILNDVEEYYHPYILEQGFNAETLRYFKVGFQRFGELENRVCFLIDAPNGDIISISGRSVDGSMPKYRIIGDSKKSKTLYNISRAKEWSVQMGYIIVVEGFKSVMRLYQEGYKNCVACMGSSVSDDQIKLLLGLGVRILVCGDLDDAGKIMAQKCYNQLYKYVPISILDIGKVTDKEESSPADLDEDEMFEFIAEIENQLNLLKNISNNM